MSDQPQFMTPPQFIPPAATRPWVYLVWGSAILLSGVVVGAAGALVLHHSPPPGWASAGGPDERFQLIHPHDGPPELPRPRPDNRGGGRPEEPSPKMIAERMQRDMRLADAQTSQITESYTRTLAALKKVREEMGPKLLQENEKLREDLKKILTAEQFMEWDEHYKEMRDRMMPPPPPRDGHDNDAPDTRPAPPQHP